MKSGKSAAAAAAKEDPEAKARREVDEARAEADKTSALQSILDRRSRKIMRIFGKPVGAATAPAGSGASGVPGGNIFSGAAGGVAFAPPNIGKFDVDFSKFNALGPSTYY